MNSPKATVVYLTGDSEREFQCLKKSLKLLRKNFLKAYPYPVRIFHEPGYAQVKRGYLKQFPGIELSEITFEIPAYLDRDLIPEIFDGGSMKYSLGYRHMCRFFSGTIFLHPALASYDYYWRLDTDSYLPRKLRYDPFRFLAENGLEYGYNYCFRDAEWAVRGLWETTRKFIAENNITPKFLHRFLENGEWTGHCFYSNFEIASLRFFRSQEYQRYFDYLDKSGGIYTGRWGDNSIHLLGVSLFLEESKTHLFHDIDYIHYPIEVSRKRGISCGSWGLTYLPPNSAAKEWKKVDLLYRLNQGCRKLLGHLQLRQ